MAKLQMKSGFTHKLKLPLILTLAHSIMKRLGLAEYIIQTTVLVVWQKELKDIVETY